MKRGIQILIILILTTMTSGSNFRDLPASDTIKTPAGDVEMFFIGHGSLMFRVNDFCIHIDPVRSSGSYENLPEADLILVTHEHYDHLDPELIATLKKEDTIMFSNGTAASEINWAQAMAAGDVRSAGGIVIEAVPAYNIVNMRSPGLPFHPKGVGIGFILTIGDKRFYVAGDTENTPEMKALKDIHVAFLPMNLPYTMSPEMVADAALAFRPEILYPYHYGETDTGKLAELLRNSGIEIRIRDLK
ncbi:MAG: MBL fold metallo-hydrolase [Bacteroidales bacterium]|jgi:L-ascorbate metabolism protein UlaG (beta-lactamase superfamily)|nr:MBL fold metallo-hydrolase [Bacteroidales bacterium]